MERDLKRVIHGVVYDTDAAEEIAFGSHRHELSDAWWRLYRTSTGVFFEVAADHDGVIESVRPLTDAEARRFLEVNSNSRVEEIFGPLEQPVRPRFSRRTMLAAAEVLKTDRNFTHSTLTTFLQVLGPDVRLHVRDEPISLAKRMNDLVDYLDANAGVMADGALVSERLVERGVTSVPAAPRSLFERSTQQNLPAHIVLFTRALADDGYGIFEGVLRRILPEEVTLPEKESALERLLKKHGLTVPKGHLDQARDAHARGDWAAANSQVRTFLEGLLDEIAIAIDPTLATGSSENRRAGLARQGFLSSDLNEWSGDGKNFINGLMKRLHPQGSHPGLSDEDDSSFRLHIVLLTSQMLLARFDARVAQS